MKAVFNKTSESGKRMLVGIQANRYQTGYTFAWCAKPEDEEYEKMDVISGFPQPKGTRQLIDPKEGTPLVHANGEPVLEWVF